MIEKDIPLIQSVYPDEFTAVLVKGRGNYVSLRRLKAAQERARNLFIVDEEIGQLRELAQWAKNKVQDLSKGMQQKVQFATALIHEPALVILDEPWSGLDPINAEVLAEVVEEIRASGRTVLFSTHGMEQAEKVVDAVCIIARGKKVLDGKLADIKRENAPKGLIALEFLDDGSRGAAERVERARLHRLDAGREDPARRAGRRVPRGCRDQRRLRAEVGIHGCGQAARAVDLDLHINVLRNLCQCCHGKPHHQQCRGEKTSRFHVREIPCSVRCAPAKREHEPYYVEQRTHDALHVSPK